MEKTGRLLFVYNADSGIRNKAFDFLHKAINPATYQCSLCSITYGTFTMRDEWKKFVANLPYQVEFWYKDEFLQKHTPEPEFPCVFLKKDHSMKLLLKAADMEAITQQELKNLLIDRLVQ